MKMYKIGMELFSETSTDYMYAYGETVQEAIKKAESCCDEVVSCNPTDVKLFCIVRTPRREDEDFTLYYQGVRLSVKAKSLETIEYALSKYPHIIDSIFNDYELFHQTYIVITDNKINIRYAIPKVENIKHRIWMEV